jgi:hypothetical protein
MNSSSLIEGCPSISIGSLSHDLLRYRNRDGDISGNLNIKNGEPALAYSYHFDYSDVDSLVILNNNTGSIQYVELASQELNFGTRNRFICECGRGCNNLYLPHGADSFKCRNCHHLRYELSRINRASRHGQLLYITNRTIKLIGLRSSISRPLYRSRYTKRMNTFIKLSRQAGLVDVVEDAHNFQMAIYGQ